jgi:acyl-CoA dehydrogenase family protein 9
VHPALAKRAAAVSEQTVRLRDRAEVALRKHGKRVQEMQLIQKRLSEAASGIYAQVAVLSRISGVIQRDGLTAAAEERAIAINFCKSSEREVSRHLRALEINDDRYTKSIGAAVRERGAYAYSL